MAEAFVISLIYVTARKEPCFHWWAQSLHRETRGDYTGLQVVVIDFYAEAHRDGEGWTAKEAEQRRRDFAYLCPCPNFIHSSPIWNPWQGPHRTTKDNWFAKADYLNAALCLAQGPFLASCDDLSVLSPGWLAAVINASEWAGITCGAYRKVKSLVVEDGEIKSFVDDPNGHDWRWAAGSDAGPVPCIGYRMYGCSFAGPIARFPQMTHGLGYEDSHTGAMLERNGVSFRYDRRMLTLESQEHHFIGKQMRREDPGVSPKDKSHAFVERAMGLRSWPNYFGEGGIAAVRAKVQAGEPLPIISEPALEWFTGTPLRDL